MILRRAPPGGSLRAPGGIVLVVDESALQLWSVNHAARVVGVSPRTMWRLVHADPPGIASITVGRRRLIPATAVAAFIAERGADIPAA